MDEEQHERDFMAQPEGDLPIIQPAQPLPASLGQTTPNHALVLVPQPSDPIEDISTAPGQPLVPPPSFAADAGQPVPVELPPPISPPPPLPSVETPLYLQNPGPPPRLPRNQNVTNLGRVSYKLRDIRPGAANYRPLLWACAAIGVVILFLLIVVKVQNHPISPTLPDGVTVETVGPNEQFGLVIVQDAPIRAEPYTDATQLSHLTQYSVVNLQKHSNNDWYSLQDSPGWVAASNLQVYPDRQAAEDARQKLTGS